MAFPDPNDSQPVGGFWVKEYKMSRAYVVATVSIKLRYYHLTKLFR